MGSTVCCSMRHRYASFQFCRGHNDSLLAYGSDRTSESGELFLVVNSVSLIEPRTYTASQIARDIEEQFRADPSSDRLSTLVNCLHGFHPRLRQSASSVRASVVAALVHAGMVTIANVGSTRAYALGRQHLFDRFVSPQPAVRLGDDGQPWIETTAITQFHKFVLLCSDGLTSIVPDDAIEAALRDAGSPEEVSLALMTLLVEKGITDDATAIVILFGDDTTKVGGEPAQAIVEPEPLPPPLGELEAGAAAAIPASRPPITRATGRPR